MEYWSSNRKSANFTSYRGQRRSGKDFLRVVSQNSLISGRYIGTMWNFELHFRDKAYHRD